MPFHQSMADSPSLTQMLLKNEVQGKVFCYPKDLSKTANTGTIAPPATLKKSHCQTCHAENVTCQLCAEQQTGVKLTPSSINSTTNTMYMLSKKCGIKYGDMQLSDHKAEKYEFWNGCVCKHSEGVFQDHDAHFCTTEPDANSSISRASNELNAETDTVDMKDICGNIIKQSSTPGSPVLVSRRLLRKSSRRTEKPYRKKHFRTNSQERELVKGVRISTTSRKTSKLACVTGTNRLSFFQPIDVVFWSDIKLNATPVLDKETPSYKEECIVFGNASVDAKQMEKRGDDECSLDTFSVVDDEVLAYVGDKFDMQQIFSDTGAVPVKFVAIENAQQQVITRCTESVTIDKYGSECEDMLSESLQPNIHLLTGLGFQTASKKSITISDKALQWAENLLLGDEEIS